MIFRYRGTFFVYFSKKYDRIISKSTDMRLSHANKTKFLGFHNDSNDHPSYCYRQVQNLTTKESCIHAVYIPNLRYLCASVASLRFS